MPKINAPTVREHHEQVKEKLVSGTERILWESGPEALSAAAVAKTAGIARNSIYRYVESVDDLRLLAIARHMPRWWGTVFAKVDEQAEPSRQLAQFMVACVEQTKDPTHAWLVKLVRYSSSNKKRGSGDSGQPSGLEHGGSFIMANFAQVSAAEPVGEKADKRLTEREKIKKDIAKLHLSVDEFIVERWREIGVDDVELWAAYTRALLYEALKMIEKMPESVAIGAILRASVLAMVRAGMEQAGSRGVGGASGEAGDGGTADIDAGAEEGTDRDAGDAQDVVDGGLLATGADGAGASAEAGGEGA